MIKVHLKIAWRNILKYKMLSTINISGLALGIATCITIVLFVADEYSYDRYNQFSDRIYRVILKGKISDEVISEAVTPAPVAKTMQQEFPEVELGVRLKNSGTPRISVESNSFRNSRLAFVDPEFFQVFTLPMIQGDPNTVLQNPNTVVITKETAEKFFGTENPIGKSLEFEDLNEEYIVTGIMENVPGNSHFHFDLFATTFGLKDALDFEWIQSNGYSYILLREPNQVSELALKLPAMVEKYMGPQIQQALGLSYSDFELKGNHVGLFLQPLTDIYLRSDFTEQSELESRGSIKTLYILSGVAIFILLIACINFMNLSTSMATKRAREVGLKKVLGGGRSQLMTQYLLESTLVTLIAMGVAMLLVAITLPYFNILSGKTLQVTTLFDPKVLTYVFGFGLLVGLLAGVYPAFVLSSLRPISALKESILRLGSGQKVRAGLVVFQFAVSVILIISTLIADLQMSYILNKDLGFEKDHIMVLRDSWMLGDKEVIFKEQLEADTRVASITRSGYIPAGTTNSSMYNIYPDPNSDSFRRTSLYYVDDDYLETMGMQLIHGSNFSSDQDTDSSSTIINETAAKLFGLDKNPIGHVITMASNNMKRDLKIIGVVKDFHFNSLYQPIEPLFMLNVPNSGLILRAGNRELSGLISHVETLWKQFNTGEPFSYTILDESYRNIYVAESNLRSVLRVFTFLSIFVALIGLFGLVSFSTEQRFKEIGIRKVLGSSATQIVTLLARNFVKLVSLSLLIAIPVSYYLVKQGLRDFAYRIDIPWWVFLVAALLTLILAFATVSLRSIKAALTNPVDALRNE